MSNVFKSFTQKIPTFNKVFRQSNRVIALGSLPPVNEEGDGGAVSGGDSNIVYSYYNAFSNGVKVAGNILVRIITLNSISDYNDLIYGIFDYQNNRINALHRITTTHSPDIGRKPPLKRL